ncbi:M24 family metallopeptidase [Poriferisphaera sp. WC338]|uniref:M24 family metallopeptidase n=1 Tax=Poriferisphaera sp. WC338 TaxID=3425129 RepID=UPI003D81825A
MAKRRQAPRKKTVKNIDIFKMRISVLRKRMKLGVHVDAALITNPVDIRYLTGFVGDDSWALVPMKAGKVVVLSDSRFEEQIANEAPQVKVVMRKAGLAEALKELLEKLGMKKISVQPSYMTVGVKETIGKAIGARHVVAFDEQLIEQRAIKDADEIKLIEKALVIQQCAFNQTIAGIRVGMSEYEIAGLLEYKMRTLGADGVSFPSIVAVDANASLPHAIPRKKKVRKGSLVLIDWGAKYQGYCSDLTRVVCIGGELKGKKREIYEVCLAAQEAGIAAIRPGVSMVDVDRAARSVIEQAGYGEQFGHGLGHGIGLDIHEQPVLSARGKGLLTEGQVVTVEPGIYLPGVGGVRIEDDVLVTEKGHKVLSDLPKSLESTIIKV